MCTCPWWGQHGSQSRKRLVTLYLPSASTLKACFLLIQSQTSARGIAPPLFRVSLPSSTQLFWKHLSRRAHRVVSKVISPAVKLARINYIGSKKYCALNTLNKETRRCQQDIMGAGSLLHYGFFQSDSLQWFTEPSKSDVPCASKAHVL